MHASTLLGQTDLGAPALVFLCNRVLSALAPPQQALSYPLKRVSHWLLLLPGAHCIWQPFIAPAEEVNLCLDKVFPGITLEVCCCKH